MKDALHQVIGELLDAVFLGIKVSVVCFVAWPAVVLILKLTPAALKALGVWP